MSEVGALIIRLQAETAQFREDMGRVKGDLKDIQGGASDTGGAFDGSMRDSTGAVRLLTHELGVPLPRELSRLVATIPGVGAAFSAMLPIIGIVAAGVVIEKLVEKHEALAEAIRKTTQQNQDLAISEDDAANRMEVVNLKLEDQIAKLEGRPEINKLKIALIENENEVDSLAAHFATSFEKMDKDISTGTTFFGYFWQAMKNVNDTASTWNPFGALNTGAKQAADLGRAIESVKKSEDDVAEAADNMHNAQTGNDAERLLAAKLYSDTLKEQAQILASALAVAEGQASPNEAQIAALKEMGHQNRDQQQQQIALAQEAALKIQLINEEAEKKIRDEKEKTYEEGVADIEKGIAAEIAGLDRSERMNEEVQRDIEAGVKKEMEDRKRAAEEIAKLNQEKYDDLISGDKQRISEVENSESLAADIIKNKAALGVLSKIEEQKQLLGILKQEQADLKAAQDKELSDMRIHAAQMRAAAQAAQGTSNEAAAIQNEIQAQRQLDAAIKQADKSQTDFDIKIADSGTSIARLASSWKTYFTAMKTETQDLSTQIRVNLQGSVIQFTKSFGDSMAQCIVENKNLAQAVTMEAGHMLESMISMLVQWLEKWVITHVMAAVTGKTTDQTAGISAAGLAGANMVASWAAAPWPIDALAPAMGAEAFGAALAFASAETGGIIPGSGPVPILGHGGETIVTKALTDRVEQSEGRSSDNGGKREGDSHFHAHITAFDGDDVVRTLQRHGPAFAQAWHDQVRAGHVSLTKALRGK